MMLPVRRAKRDHRLTTRRATALVVVLAAWCCSRSVQAQEPTTDPLDVQVLKNLAHKYNISSWTFGDDPCGQKASSIFVGYLKCVCTYNNGTTCHVTELYPYEKGLRGTFPLDALNLTHLTRLDFGHNFLHGSLPSELGTLTGLTHLGFGTNYLTGVLPRELGNLTSLTELYLDSNYFNGSLPAELGSLSQLQTLWLLDNDFSSFMPDIFGHMKSLLDLRIYGTKLQGPIPTSMGNLLSLQTIYIGDLTSGGPFPEGLTRSHNLTALSLRNNGLTGSIPSALSRLSALQTLDLSFNALTGSIPSTLADISALNTVYPGSNKLTGVVPQTLLDSKSLKVLDLSFNQLEGSPSTRNQFLDLNPIWNSFSQAGNYPSNESDLPLSDCSLHSDCSGPTHDNSNFAIDVGGSSAVANYDTDKQNASVYVSPQRTWLASASGSTKVITASGEITGSDDAFLFMTARQAYSSLRYFGLGMRNGMYKIELQFAETGFYDNSLARRVFDVYLQESLALKDFDIQKAANGSYKAHKEELSANVTNNVLDIHFFWAGKGTCCIPNFYDYGPLISAIRVYSGSLSFETGNGRKSGKPAALIAGICTGALVLAICGLFIFARRRRRPKPVHRARDGKEFVSFEGSPMLYSYKDLQTATKDFHPDNMLGQGGFGAVYKGVLRDGSTVAIKELSACSKQGEEEFMNEVTLISTVQHRNVVKLRGCCLEGSQPVLVYEYVENKSLDKILFEPCDTITLDWPMRFNIILGVARGLAYLHDECHAPIIHRDVKAANILLDNKLQPKIADFGLARLVVEDATHVTTRVAGTWGYMAPEYAFRGKLTVKADVYSFGVLVLEVVSGRRNRDLQACEEQAYLLDWTWDLHEKGRLLQLTDSWLKEDNIGDEIVRVIQVALLCVVPTAHLRPSMMRAVSMLQGDVQIGPLPPKPAYFGDSRTSSKTLTMLGSKDTYTSGSSSAVPSSYSHGSSPLSSSLGLMSSVEAR